VEDEEPIVTEEQRGKKRSQDDEGKNTSHAKVRKTQMSEVLAFMKEQSEAAEKRRSKNNKREMLGIKSEWI